MGCKHKERGYGTSIPLGFLENTVCFDTWDSPDPLVSPVVRDMIDQKEKLGQSGVRRVGGCVGSGFKRYCRSKLLLSQWPFMDMFT